MDLQLYEGTVQEGDQLYWKMSMIRFAYDPADADAWVEEPVTDPDDVNAFKWTGEILPLSLRLLTEKAECLKRQSANQSVGWPKFDFQDSNEGTVYRQSVESLNMK